MIIEGKTTGFILGAIDAWGDVFGRMVYDDDSKHPYEWRSYKRWRYIPEIGLLHWWETPDESEKEIVEEWLENKGYEIKLRVTMGGNLKPWKEELEYPLASKDELQSYGGMEGWKGKLIWMDPSKFLKLANPMGVGDFDKESYKNLKDRMSKKLPIDFLVLIVDMERKKIIGHEGRHRATVAKELWIKKVPVLIYTGEVFKRLPKWDPEDHDVVDNLRFKPEWQK